MLQPLLLVKQLSKRISSDNETRSLFSSLNAQIYPGERISLTGPSGQGKTSLLRLLALLDPIDSGELLLYGKPPVAWGPRIWRKSVTYVSQHSVMLPGSVHDNLKSASTLHGIPFDQPLALKLMDTVGLGKMSGDQPASELSGGEKQRVALIRSLLLYPEFLLLDEVTASLDAHSKEWVEHLLLEWHKVHGTGFLWITHDNNQAKRVASRSWQLSGGRLSEGDPACL